MYNMMMPRNRMNRNQELNLFGDRFFDHFFDTDTLFDQRAFRVDVRKEPDAYELSAELPGMKQEQIEITAHEGVLTISANMNAQRKEEKEGYVYSERRTGRFARSFNLEGVKEDAITARYEDGVLTLHLPKETPEQAQPRRIAIETGSEAGQQDA